jgi:hypothetical protein
VNVSKQPNQHYHPGSQMKRVYPVQISWVRPWPKLAPSKE